VVATASCHVARRLTTHAIGSLNTIAEAAYARLDSRTETLEETAMRHLRSTASLLIGLIAPFCSYPSTLEAQSIRPARLGVPLGIYACHGRNQPQRFLKLVVGDLEYAFEDAEEGQWTRTGDGPIVWTSGPFFQRRWIGVYAQKFDGRSDVIILQAYQTAEKVYLCELRRSLGSRLRTYSLLDFVTAVRDTWI